MSYGLYRYRGKWLAYEWPHQPNDEKDSHERIDRPCLVKVAYPNSLVADINAALGKSKGGLTLPEIVMALVHDAGLNNPGQPRSKLWDVYRHECEQRGYSPIAVMSCLMDGHGPKMTWCEEQRTVVTDEERKVLHYTVARWSAA